MAEAPDAGAPQELLGVYESHHAADVVCATLVEAGAEAYVISPDDREGEEVVRLALVAEMQEDATESKASAQVGSAYPKEAAKGLAIVAPFVIPASVIVGLIAGLLLLPGASIGARLLIGAVVGGVGGAVIALVVGPAIAAPRPGVPSAAQRGVIVWCRSWDPAYEGLMAASSPIRLDRRLPDGVFQTVTTEDRSEGTGVLTEISRNTTEAPVAGNDWEQGGPEGLADRDPDRDRA